jgi:hypothetical protein
LASSSKGKPEVGWGGAGGVADEDTAVGDDVVLLNSLRATTTPEEELSVLRGLPNVAWLATMSAERGATARETAGSRLPSAAGFGRFARCQS